MGKRLKIFFERELDAILATIVERMKLRIQREDHNYLLNVNPEEYVAHLASEFQIAPLLIDFDGLNASFSEAMTPAESFPPTFSVFSGKAYSRQVVRYHIPFRGDEGLLDCIPSPGVMNTFPVVIENGAICFELVNFYNDPDRIKRDADSKINLIRSQYQYLAAQIERFNLGLSVSIRTALEARRAEVMKQRQFVAALGVPIRASAQVSSTFAVPAIRKKIQLPKPIASTEPYSPEPTLDQSTYDGILKVINDTGKVFERLPSTYWDKGEEDLRDHLILQLTPHFELTSTTGETFNKSGKTDILIRYDNRNIFVAECKVWKGESNHLKTIDQLLSYLTWRDSKTAIVYFVPTKEMVAPLRAIETSTSGHPCFEAAKGKHDESWFNFDFHLPGDKSRRVHMAVLCFHLPARSRKEVSATS